MIIVLIIVAVLVVVGVSAVVVARRRRRTAPILAPAAREAMPEVLVTEVAERPVLVDEVQFLEKRLGSSRSIFERVRAISSVGSLNQDQLDTVEEVLLRSDAGVATTTAILDDLRENGAPEGVAAAVRKALLGSLTADRSVTAPHQRAAAG